MTAQSSSQGKVGGKSGICWGGGQRGYTALNTAAGLIADLRADT